MHLLQAGLLDLGVSQGDEGVLHRLMGLLIICEALKSSAQLPQTRQLLSGIGPSREPCIELLQSLQLTRLSRARVASVRLAWAVAYCCSRL